MRIFKKVSFFSLLFAFIVSGVFIYKKKTYNTNQASTISQENADLKLSKSFDISRWIELTQKLDLECKRYRATVGIYFKDLTSNMVWEHNADKLFISASLIKLPIMIAVMDLVERRKVSFDTEFVITDKDKVWGSGSLKWAMSGTRIPLLEIIYRMITESDNTATRILIDNFGIDYFQTAFRKMGLKYTNITLEGLDLTSGRVAKENYTTPREMAYLLEKIYRGEVISKEKSALMLDILKRTKSHSRIRKGIPYTWEVGHKTGLLRRSCSDVGIIFSPKGDYILAILLDDVPSYSSGKNFISKIAKITSEYYKI